MKINSEKICSRLEELYQCGARDDGTFTRMAYSKEDLKGREMFRSWFEELGVSTRIDQAGNIIARLEGENPKLPAIMIGSHLDTVPDGGKYDGVLGCVAGLGVCEAFIEEGKRPKHPLEVVVFTDEEGFRFGSGLLGSSAFCGETPDICDSDLDIFGETRGEVMKAYGITVSEVHKAARSGDSVHCFLELHIEQGASLYKSNTPVGIVSSIAGVSRYEITITGEANHAGSTMMGDRRDALVTASGFIAEVPRIVKTCGQEYTVATVGTIKVTPNSVNVIPGTCTFQLEIRDQSNEIMELTECRLKAFLDTICSEQGQEYSFEQISYHRPEPMSDWVKGAIKKSVESFRLKYAVIPSGAFHDALIMTASFPTGMIFVPSIRGISHSRHEQTTDEDIEKGCAVLLETVLEVDTMK